MPVKKKKSGVYKQALVRAAWSLCAATAIVALPARFTAPARTVFLQYTGPLLKQSYSTLGDASAATGTLRDALINQEQAKINAGRLQNLENRNHLLRESLHTTQTKLQEYESLDFIRQDFRALSADVIAYETIPGRRSITIAAGTRHGIAKGQAVASGGSVIGVIDTPGPSYSRVRLLTDPAASIPVLSMRTRTLYALKGLDGLGYQVQMAETELDIREGDILVTTTLPAIAGKGAIVPPGLPVAEVTSVQRNEKNPLFYRVEAAPLVNHERLEHVMVITKPS